MRSSRRPAAPASASSGEAIQRWAVARETETAVRGLSRRTFSRAAASPGG